MSNYTLDFFQTVVVSNRNRNDLHFILGKGGKILLIKNVYLEN